MSITCMHVPMCYVAFFINDVLTCGIACPNGFVTALDLKIFRKGLQEALPDKLVEYVLFSSQHLTTQHFTTLDLASQNVC